MTEPRGQELIERYKANYRIPSDAPITEDMILSHWELEKQLTQELLRSTPENRFEVFQASYSKLYSELEWLNEYVKKDVPRSIREDDFRPWLRLIGTPSGQKIYEVGSGTADLISFLAQRGYSCVATEITKERGEKYSGNNVVWRHSDGVHLGDFEPRESYDVVISDQVIEHIHPDDTQSHFRGVLEILKPRGRYIFRVPHRLTGPHDISRVFNCDRALGMHLKEMTFWDIRRYVTRAGFSQSGVVVIDARRPIKKLFSKDGLVSTPTYFSLLIICEGFIKSIPRTRFRSWAIQFASRLGFFPGLFVVAKK